MTKRESPEELKKRRKKRRKQLERKSQGGVEPVAAEVASKSDSKPERRSRIPKQILGSKYVRLLEQQFSQLRDESEQHGNRQLFLDDVFIVYLLAFFNPAIRSLRTLEDLSQTPHAQKHLSMRKVCKSTLSDFNQLIDPDRLQPILTSLRAQLGRKTAGKSSADRDLQTLLNQTVAVDGTFLPAVAEVAWSIANSNDHGIKRHRARIDARVNVATWMPEAIVIPDPGESESDSAIRHLQPGKVYVYDRGYTGFALLKAHYGSSAKTTEAESPNPESHFVVRYKKPGVNASELRDSTDQTLTAEDLEAGITSDRAGYFRTESAGKAGLENIKLREVVATYEENGETKILRLITNLHDVSAATVALLYQHRWQVELFFRWFKVFGNFDHLISHSRQGALAHLYVTIIGVMLMYLHTGYRPSKYMFALLGQVAAGQATLEEIIPILRERERRNELDRQSAARRRAKKKAETN